MENFVSNASIPGTASRVLDNELLLMSDEAPPMFIDVERDQHWRLAMLEEMK
jgi:hypothetical protein